MVEESDVTRALEKCLAKPSTPEVIDGHPCPLRVMFMLATTRGKSLEEQLVGRRILFTCSALRGWQPPAPNFVQEDMVILQVLDNKEELRYGFRSVPYRVKCDESWESNDTDEEAASRPLKLAELLVDKYDCSRDVSMLGVSAGVDIVLSICASPAGAGLSVKYITLIAGAYHPMLYGLASKRLYKDDTYVIVLNHIRDTRCPWERVGDEWKKCRANAVVRCLE